MTDFKGQELNVGDKVITISSWGYRMLEEGVITRLTPHKVEVDGKLKDTAKVFKLA